MVVAGRCGVDWSGFVEERGGGSWAQRRGTTKGRLGAGEKGRRRVVVRVIGVAGEIRQWWWRLAAVTVVVVMVF